MKLTAVLKSCLCFGLISLAAISVSATTTAVPAGALQFSSGNTFQSVVLEGSPQVICQSGGRQETAFVQCSSNDLFPGDFDYLVSDGSIDATSIVLSNTVGQHQVSQERNFSVKKKQSSSPYNLWIWTLTQRGLLNMGANQVAYELKKSGKSAGTGQITVNVVDGGTKRCPSIIVYSGNMLDCQAPSQFICDQYFQQANYCQ